MTLLPGETKRVPPPPDTPNSPRDITRPAC